MSGPYPPPHAAPVDANESRLSPAPFGTPSLDGHQVLDSICDECGTPGTVTRRSGLCRECEEDGDEGPWQDPCGYFSRGYD